MPWFIAAVVFVAGSWVSDARMDRMLKKIQDRGKQLDKVQDRQDDRSVVFDGIDTELDKRALWMKEITEWKATFDEKTRDRVYRSEVESLLRELERRVPGFERPEAFRQD